jgi:hypothetical protein
VGNPFNMDWEAVLQVLAIIFLIGLALLRALWRAFARPLRPAPEQEQPAEDSMPTELRRMLDQIRRQAKGGAGQGAGAGEAAAGEAAPVPAPVPANVAPVPGHGAGAGADPIPAPVPRADEPVFGAPSRPRAGRRSAERAARRAERREAGEAVEAGERERKRARRLARELEEREISSVAGRHLESRVEGRRVGGGLEDRHIESRVVRDLEAKYGKTTAPLAGRPRALRLPGMPAGVGLREAVVLQVLLGPPAAKRGPHRWTPRGSW